MAFLLAPKLGELKKTFLELDAPAGPDSRTRDSNEVYVNFPESGAIWGEKIFDNLSTDIGIPSRVILAPRAAAASHQN